MKNLEIYYDLFNYSKSPENFKIKNCQIFCFIKTTCKNSRKWLETNGNFWLVLKNMWHSKRLTLEVVKVRQWKRFRNRYLSIIPLVSYFHGGQSVDAVNIQIQCHAAIHDLKINWHFWLGILGNKSLQVLPQLSLRNGKRRFYWE